MAEYTVSAVAAHVAGEYEAESATEAIDKATADIGDALEAGEFQLTEIEADAVGDVNDWAIDHR